MIDGPQPLWWLLKELLQGRFSALPPFVRNAKLAMGLTRDLKALRQRHAALPALMAGEEQPRAALPAE